MVKMDKNRIGKDKFLPPIEAVNNAKMGLMFRKKYHRGGLDIDMAKSLGIDSGITRAMQIISGKPLGIEIVRKMARFNRHRRNFRPEIMMKDGGPTSGTIAWLLWGGNEGIDWAISVSKNLRNPRQ